VDDRDFVITHKAAIENFVNSQEAEQLLGDNNFLDAWEASLQPRLIAILGQPLPEAVEEALYSDLRDWWKNGNFRHWEDDEVGMFGIGKWQLEEEDFWFSILDSQTTSP
jgi:hypothetical protein